MPLSREIKHIYEPTPLQCGQAVLAMATGIDVNEIVKLCGTENETDLKTMRRVFTHFGISVGNGRISVSQKEQLPKAALLSLETPKCWHWSLYANGKFYDPEYGLIDDFPPSKRRYYWVLNEEV